MGPVKFPSYPKKDKRYKTKGPIKKKQYPPVEKIHHKRARKLHQAVKEQGLLMAPFNQNKWANDFKRLENKILNKTKKNVPTSEIDRTLSWYISKLGDRFLPVCSSASSFYIRFWDIFSSKEKDGPFCEKISPLAKQIVKELTDVWDYPHWPGVSREQMPAAVQLSLDAYSEFFDKACIQIKKVISKCKRTGGMGNNILEHKNRETERFAQYLDEIGPRSLGCLPDPGFPLTHPDAFVKRWFGDLYHLRVDWDKWDGKLNREVWSLHHPRFQQQMLSWSDIKGDKEHWHQLMELVGE